MGCVLEDKSEHILCLPKDLCSNDGVILKLKHPKASKTMLVYKTQNNDLHELLAVTAKCQSWFVGQSVVDSNQLIFGAPIDPLFLVLPYLINSTSHFSPLDQILVDENYSACSHLDDIIETEQLKNICDVKPAVKAVKFNKNKTLDWLVKKVDAVVAGMKENKVLPGYSSLDEEEYLKYAAGIVCDYVSPSLASDLYENLGIELLDLSIQEQPAKKQKIEKVEFKENVPKSKAAPKKKVNKSHEKLAKVNTKGMKSMSSFFAKKSS